MNQTPPFPRVLVISSHVFNLYDGGGIALTNFFKDWPTDRIAEIYHDSFKPDRSVCKNFYKLGPDEIRWVWPLSRFYKNHVNDSNQAGPAPETKGKGLRFLKSQFELISRVLGGKEIFGSCHASQALRAWVESFKPDVIFTQLGGIYVMSVIWELSNKYDIPIVFQITDNWIDDAYRSGLLAKPLRRRLLNLTGKIIEHAKVRYVISDPMRRSYSEKFGKDFTPLLTPVDIDAWSRFSKDPLLLSSRPKITYVGTIAENAQLEGLRMAAEAVENLNKKGQPLDFYIYTLGATAFKKTLEVGPYTRVLNSPPSSEVASLLSSSDVLLIPISFDAHHLRYIRFSLPGKIPAYLASKTPILVFGPPSAAPVEYAQKEKWGYVVAENDRDKLEVALKKLVTDGPLRKELSERAFQVAEKNHEAHSVRGKFRDALIKATNKTASPQSPS